MAKTRKLPYWLAAGTDGCSACEHTVVLEMLHRCEACDRGLCEHCVVVLETRVVRCAECAAAGEEED